MHDGVEAAGLEDAIEGWLIAGVGQYKVRAAGNGLLAAFAEIVQHRDRMAVAQQTVGNHAADVPSSSRD